LTDPIERAKQLLSDETPLPADARRRMARLEAEDKRSDNPEARSVWLWLWEGLHMREINKETP
jgi:hypothetical protein